jgi:hypothetical protein
VGKGSRQIRSVLTIQGLAPKEKLEETDNEFENFRQRSLEREQKIRRKLQDELNKHKK